MRTVDVLGTNLGSVWWVDANVGLVAARNALGDEAGAGPLDSIDDFRVLEPPILAFARTVSFAETRAVFGESESFGQDVVERAHVIESVLEQGLSSHRLANSDALDRLELATALVRKQHEGIELEMQKFSYVYFDRLLIKVKSRIDGFIGVDRIVDDSDRSRGESTINERVLQR